MYNRNDPCMAQTEESVPFGYDEAIVGSTREEPRSIASEAYCDVP